MPLEIAMLLFEKFYFEIYYFVSIIFFIITFKNYIKFKKLI